MSGCARIGCLLTALASCICIASAGSPRTAKAEDGGQGQAGDVVLFWNVENLFDCRHDTLKNDYDFLPEGSHRWTHHRYWRKLDDISRTLAAVTEEEGQ